MKIARTVFLSLVVCAGTMANAGLLYDRGLPEANLNNASGADRSNVAWANEDSNVALLGDDFTLADKGTHRIDTIRLWVVREDDQVFGGFPMALVTTRAADGIDGLLIGNRSDSFTATAVTYKDGQTYQGSSGAPRKLWQVDFEFNNYFVEGGDKQIFFLEGRYVGGDFNGYTPFMHASNSLLSGSKMEGADNSMYSLSFGDAPSITTWDSNGNGWDKSSDFNIQVMGERAVPGPVAVLPFAVGLLAAARRRRK